MYLYFDEVMGLVWSNDCESYASGSISTGRTTQVMIQTKTDTLILQVGGWGIRLTNSSQKKKKLIVQRNNNGCQKDHIGKRQGKCYKIMNTILLLGRYSVYYTNQEC